MKQLLTLCFGSLLLLQSKAQHITWNNLDTLGDKVKKIQYAQLSDTTLNLYYIAPKAINKKQKLPAIVWIHGGAWTAGKASTFFSQAAYCSLNGAVGMSIEYRLIKKAPTSINDCIEDVKNAIRFIKANAEKLQIDTNKIVLIGESAGGHLAASMVTVVKENQYRPAALVLYNPVLDVSTGNFIRFIDANAIIHRKSNADTLALQEQFGAQARAISPLFHVQSNLPPMLIINGDADKATPHTITQQFCDSLAKYNNKFELVLLPNTPHAFAIAHYKTSEQQVIDVLTLTGKFLSSLGFLNYSKISLINSNDPNWLNKRNL
jgi:acetyl esterase/lipase